MQGMFSFCTSLIYIGKLINKGQARSIFASCNSLESVEEFQFANRTSYYDTYRIFYNISGTVELDINFTCSTYGPGYFVGINTNNTFNRPNLTRETVVKLFNCLSTFNGGSSTLGSATYPLTFRSNVRAKLTDDDIAIATAKGWSIA